MDFVKKMCQTTLSLKHRLELSMVSLMAYFGQKVHDMRLSPQKGGYDVRLGTAGAASHPLRGETNDGYSVHQN